MDVMTASPPAALTPYSWGAPRSLWDTSWAPRSVRTLYLLLLAPSLSTQIGKTAVKTSTFTYHAVQAPLLDFPPAASCVCVLRPAGKARDQVGFHPPDIPGPPLDCEFCLYNMELKIFHHE